MSGWDQHHDIESLEHDVKSRDWTHSICDDCWKRKEPDRTPVRIKVPDNQADICCYCHIPTRSGIYYRDDPALFTECQHNLIVLVRPQDE
jgi:hypothetical protein